MSPFRYMTIMALALALGGCGDYGSDTEPESTTSTRAPAPATTEQDAAPAGAADACPAAPTPAQTEGPYFSPGAPRKADLAQDGDGDVIVVRGAVYDAACAPAAGLRIDFWQTDADGVYDNDGFRFRGHQLTNATGGYELRTVVPGAYTGRTEHIHVKLSGDGGELLTTQLYVPGVSDQDEDSAGLFDEDNVIASVESNGSTQQYRFDFRLP